MDTPQILKTIAVAWLTLNGAFAASANITQINRYATVDNKPLAAQINPLLTVQQIHFPKQVVTVGDAVMYWIRYSGFKLASDSQQPSALKTIMAQPLPQVDRNLGPLTIQDGLTVLLGQEVFTLVQSPLSRTVTFKLKPKYVPARGHSA